MTKRMLIDATHPEETRVAVVDGNRLEEFDYESIVRKQLKGGIYLAKVTRVEPSLQAAFVNFGGNRHGFLPFSEIHPDYYRLPIADREAIIAEQQEEMEARRRQEEELDNEENDSTDDDDEQDEVDEVGGGSADDDVDEEAEENSKKKPSRGRGRKGANSRRSKKSDDETAEDEKTEEKETKGKAAPKKRGRKPSKKDNAGKEVDGNVKAPDDEEDIDDAIGNKIDDDETNDVDGNKKETKGRGRGGRGRGGRGRNNNRKGGKSAQARGRKVEVVGGDGIEGDQPVRPSLRRRYKIQEVVKRGQIMLIQVSKEERGNKGAAVTTYLSLPGRYCVLMPNSPRAGGVSRKIANYKERKRMRDVLSDLSIPNGMSVIMRTAGVARTKTEIKRDLDYLMRLWNNIRELTLQSSAPALIHEEANLIRRSIRDIYTRDVEEILAAGDEGHKFAKDFMKMMIPSHARRVKLYEDEQIPLFNRYQVESQIMEIGDPVVHLRSGGYLVINPTEALVSIDINSGKATKERHIEETALKTNLESAREIARQLRLRDLGGLVVIDFIDMEDRRNNRKVEKALRDALSTDRARIQVGRISNFGLLELSRQRLNPSLTEMQFKTCKNCEGVGTVRTTDSAAINAMRALEEEGLRRRADEVILHVSAELALYILNFKRQMLNDIENRYNLKVMIHTDDELPTSGFKIEPVKRSEPQDDDQDSEASEEHKNNNAQGNNQNNNSQDEKKNSRGGRRRGRRGGRNRSQDRHQNRDQSDTQGHDQKNRQDQQEATEAKTDEVKDDSAKNDKPKRGRGRSASKSEDAETKDVAQSTTQDEQAAQDEDKKKPASKGKKPSAKSASDKKDDKKVEDKAAAKDEPKDDSEKGKKKAAATKSSAKSKKEDKKEDQKDAAEVKTKEPSNDTAREDRDYEVVNEEPDKKKKGWWNRLVE